MLNYLDSTIQAKCLILYVAPNNSQKDSILFADCFLGNKKRQRPKKPGCSSLVVVVDTPMTPNGLCEAKAARRQQMKQNSLCYLLYYLLRYVKFQSRQTGFVSTHGTNNASTWRPCPTSACPLTPFLIRKLNMPEIHLGLIENAWHP
jgi:hypothetical protein